MLLVVLGSDEMELLGEGGQHTVSSTPWLAAISLPVENRADKDIVDNSLVSQLSTSNSCTHNPSNCSEEVEKKVEKEVVFATIA